MGISALNKPCRDCGVILTRQNHYLTMTGYLCKACHKKRSQTPQARRAQKAWRERTRERRLPYLREYGKSEAGRRAHQKFMASPKGKALIARWNRSHKSRAAFMRYVAKYSRGAPDNGKARQILKFAEFLGIVKRPRACYSCGRVKLLEAHHVNYSKPLQVFWLCRPCHRNEGHGGRFRRTPRKPKPHGVDA
jgi:Bacillus phage endonuclease